MFFDDDRFAATTQIKLLLVVPQDHRIAGLSKAWRGSAPTHAMRRQCVGGTAWMMRLPGFFSASKLRQQDDKLTSQKPEGGTYIAKKKQTKQKNTNGQKTMSQTIQKKEEREFPQCPLGFPTSFGGQLKCRFWTCQLGQKLQGSCFTW